MSATNSARFDGATYEPPVDKARLTCQLDAVRQVMGDGAWRTLAQIRVALWTKFGISATEAGVSARVRDLRKPRFGGHTIERRRIIRGLFSYRMADARSDTSAIHQSH